MRSKRINEDTAVKAVKIFLAVLLVTLVGFQLYTSVVGYPPFFKPDLLICMSGVYKAKDTNGTLLTVLNLVLTVVPVIAMVLLNMGLAVKLYLHGARVKRSVPRRTLVALGTVTWCFAVSYSFVIGHLVLEKVTGQMPWYELTMMYLLGGNVLCNPVIYFVTNKRFRNFVIKGKLRALTVSISKDTSSGNPEKYSTENKQG